MVYSPTTFYSSPIFTVVTIILSRDGEDGNGDCCDLSMRALVATFEVIHHQHNGEEMLQLMRMMKSTQMWIQICWFIAIEECFSVSPITTQFEGEIAKFNSNPKCKFVCEASAWIWAFWAVSLCGWLLASITREWPRSWRSRKGCCIRRNLLSIYLVPKSSINKKRWWQWWGFSLLDPCGNWSMKVKAYSFALR